MAKILDGVRIIDFTEGQMGTYGTMLLSDFGAEVIKIESHKTGGEPMRDRFPKNEKGSAYHAYINRGKKSVCIDRFTEEGQKLIMKLIETADVVCDPFVEGELEKCNLGYEDACKVNPSIIYASQTGFGKTGPLSYTAGSDLTAEAVCGLMNITGHEGALPTAHGSRMANQFGGVFFAMSVVAALIARNDTGEGQKVEVASADCMFTALEDILVMELFEGKPFVREGNKSRAIAPYDTFKVKDGYVSTAVSTDAQWAKFSEAMNMPELLEDPRFETNETRGENYVKVLQGMLNEKFKDMTRQEIEDTLRPLNIPSGPVLTTAEAIESEQINVRNMVVEVEDKALGKIKMPGIPIKMSGIEDVPTGSAPLLGEDTDQLLEAAGVSKEDLETLQNNDIIMCEGGVK